MSSSDLPDYVRQNVANWTEANAQYTDAAAAAAWASEEITWGLWQRPESELDVLGDVRGLDIVHSEYGAAIWADPYKWIPEAARLVRPGGRLIFLCNSTLSMLCTTLEGIGEHLVRPQRGMHKTEWPDTKEVEFHLGHGDWIDLLRENGFDVERLVELFAPADAEAHSYYKYMTPEWASQWPAEELWVARMRDG